MERLKIRKLNQLSLQWKIYLFLLSFCALLLLVLWLFQVVFLNDIYKTIKINEIKSDANSLVKTINANNYEELIDQLSKSKDICIEIITKNGSEIYSADVDRDCIIHKISIGEKLIILKKALENGGELMEYFGGRRSNKNMRSMPGTPPESIIYAKVMTDRHGDTSVILMNSVISPVNATKETLKILLYFITAFMILFAALLAFLMAKGLSKPIEIINESAKTLASGSYDVTFSGEGYKEINELSETLNITAKELAKTENMRKELMANVSHDLRTPLTLISGYAEAMRDLPQELTVENAQIIMEESNHLTRLVNDILDISSTEKTLQDMHPIRYNLTESLESAIQRISALLKKDGYSITFHYEKSVDIFADENKISRAFSNLLNNAINYSGKDKVIMVNQTISQDTVRISVKDHGEGISEESLPYIWDRYYKENSHHKRAVSGTGLGLSIVKKIIELHHGEYGVTSLPGEGSEFWFSLKLAHKECLQST